MEPIRILQVIGAMGSGGAEAMIMSLYRSIDREKVQFDFAVHTMEPQMYDGEIGELGGRIYRFPKFSGKNYGEYRKAWEEFFEKHPEHRIVHGHIGSSAAVYLKIAVKYGRYAIAHSHSTKSTVNPVRTFLWRAASYPTRYIADYFFACSKEAAVDRYGKKAASSDRCKILCNAIDTGKYSYSESRREGIRKGLVPENAYVVGHVGRHTPQKNPMFLLEVFAKIHSRDENARLLQVGGGEMTGQMKQKCRELGIEDAVVFAGVHSDVEKYYCAMDVFLFPSLWEGLGNVVVEAQTAGLHCVVSDAVPALADTKAGLFHSVDLKKTADEWAEQVLSFKGSKRLPDAADYTRRAGFDIAATSEWLQEFYLSVDEKHDK